ncbi:MAG: Translation initiation factor IF-2 [Candidatus Peregrinibacteria bacterium GW2011_GWA2_47_7]|nr:MAG: Translation initiation factor IF-2 [Candidatus Peregrinibacteria bacterium GW2011_GWA2_47_7]
MSVTLSELSKRVGISPKELREKITELGFDIKPKAIVVDDDLAELLEDELKSLQPAGAPKDTAQIYDEIYAEEREKEIVKSQRKKTAGRDDKKKKKEISASAVVPAPLSKGDALEIPEYITVKEFAEKTGINPIKIIGELMKNGILSNINQQIDFETAQILAAEFGITLKKRRGSASVEDLMAGNLEALLHEKDEEAELLHRPPVVTIMGHVDHGKTKLLDAIRDTNIVAKEAGGITQHIGAYQITQGNNLITFIDTPGHEAFSEMRARGAKVTDIAILVVSADEGVKTQTVEALNHIKEAGVPLIVAINKIDKENANIDKVKAELAEHGLQSEEWGGQTVMVPVSALTGKGIPKLLEMILLVAEMENLRANPNRPAVGTVIETHLDKSLGPIATIIINTGTLRVGDLVVIGNTHGKIKIMKDHLGKNIKIGLPSMPVQIAGINEQPYLGDILQVVTSEHEARSKALSIAQIREQGRFATSMEHIVAQISAGKLKTLKVVLKADTTGSLEAIKQALTKLKNEEVSVRVIHAGVGAITETDVNISRSSGGLVIGFNVLANQHVKKTAERLGVEIMYYQIIYKLTEDMEGLLSGLLEPEKIVEELGTLDVKEVFYTGRKEMVIGCKVQTGMVENKSMLRVFRNNAPIGTGIVLSLQKGDEKLEIIKEGNDCGIKFGGDLAVAPGDTLQSYKESFKKKTFKKM